MNPLKVYACVTAKELRDTPQKLIQDKIEALAVVRLSRVRFGLYGTFLDFDTKKAAAESLDFLKSLGYKVGYYRAKGKKIVKPTKTLQVEW